MKNTVKITVSALLAVMMLFCIVSCDVGIDTETLWESATYQSDTTLGNGGKSVTVEIKAGERSVILTLKTDKSTLGEALFEHGIVNDPVFFNICNGMAADWSRDQAYWEFKIDGKKQNHGINDVKISGGESFTLEYTK